MTVLITITVTLADTGTPALTEKDATEITRAITQVTERYANVDSSHSTDAVTLAIT